MYFLKSLILLFTLCSYSLIGQLSVSNFINESYDNDISTIKESLKEKKYEEKEGKNGKSITYYDWLNPISVKVGYIFDKEGKQRGRMLLNGKETETESKKAFEIFKREMIKIYGNDFSEMNMFGATLIQWKNIKDFKILVSRKDDKAALFVMREKDGNKK